MEKKTNTAVAQVLAAAVGWGLIGVFTRPLFAAGLNSVQLTFLRAVITAAGMGLLLLWRNRGLFRIALRDLWMFLGMGLLSIVFFNACYFFTIQHASLSAASILLYTAPCFVMLLSAALFRERVTLQKLAVLLLAFLGCALVSGFGGGIGPAALLAGLGSGLGYASYSIFGKAALAKYHTFTVVFYTFLVAAAGLCPFMDVPQIWRIAAGSPSSIGWSLGLGVVSTILPYIFYTRGLERLEPGRASVLAFAEPLTATAAGAFLFHEALGLRSAAGILLIFLALALLNLPLGRRGGGR